MAQAYSGKILGRENLFNYITRIVVGTFTAIIHLILQWQDAPIQSLIIASFQAVIYPTIMFLSPPARSTRWALGLDTFVYGCYQSLWGYNPVLIATYLTGMNTVNMAAGGVGFCLKALIYYATGLLLTGAITGFYFRPEAPTSAILIALLGLMFFLTSLGLRIFSINTNLRLTRRNLRAKTEELQSLNDLAIAVNSNLDLNTLLAKIMQSIERIYPFEAMYLVRYEEQDNLIEVAGIYGDVITPTENAAFQKLEFDTNRDADSIFVRSLVKRKVAYIPEITRERIEMAAYIDKQLYNVKPSVSLIYLPVYVNNEVVAGACFINYRNNFYLEQDDITKIQDFLVQVGTAIRNATLFKELVIATDEAEKARAKAEASEEAKGRFLANMSHEIRTPLTAIMGYTEALQEEDAKGEDQIKYVDQILRSSKHLLSMINDILDISKIEAHKIEVERIQSEYCEIIHEIDSYLRIKCREKDLTYKLEIIYPIPRKLVTDPTRLKQILYNLCNNAIKFTETGFIKFNLQIAHEWLEFRVVDSGIGISAEDQVRIFSAFDQADSSTTRLYGGTGLGLYISKNLAELLDGQLLVESIKGTGSTFILQLPHFSGETELIQNDNEYKRLIANIKEAKSLQGMPKLSGRALLVEDNINNQKLISRLVRQTGLEFDICSNGQEAIDACLNRPYDIILMDMQMPIMGGREATLQIKRNGVNTPIVAFTANVMKHHLEEYRELGIVDVVEKPIVKHKLFDTLNKVLSGNLKPLSNQILIAEDNDVNQLILFRYVTKACPTAQISIAANGEEALELTQKNKFDLVLMDMEMPVMGGLEATKRIRSIGEQMPIYIVTGNIGKEVIERCLSAGANGHLAKPIEKEVLLHTISRALNTHKFIN